MNLGTPSPSGSFTATTSLASSSSLHAPSISPVAAAATAAAAPPSTSAVTSLVTLAARGVALHARVDELLAVVEYFPASVRAEVFAHLPPVRLRELELVWESVHHGSQATEAPSADAAELPAWPFELESQDAWRARWEAASSDSGVIRAGGVHHSGPPSTSIARDRRRDYRQLFWERHVRALLKARTNALDASNDVTNAEAARSSYGASVSGAAAASNTDGEPNAQLFADVVRSLRVHGREVRALNVPLITSLRRLTRLEVHHPEQQRTCWPSLLGLLTAVPTLRELGFFHGKLTDAQLAQVRAALCDERARITTVELVSVRLRPKGFREIVALVSEATALEHLRLTSSVTDMNTRALVDAVARAPKLKTLALEHNELEDDAFQGLASVLRPMALRHLRLGDNALSSSTLGVISNASLDGFLKLERLELTNNTELCDAGVHAMTPMLASGRGDGTLLDGLQHLDLRNCEFGLEGAMNLLLALGANRSLTHLNISQNFFGTAFGDILGDFLLTNDTLQVLYADYIGLTDRGCTKRLCLALRQNRSLHVVSLAANRLRDAGACSVLRSIVDRGRLKPFSHVDLGGNLLTQRGLDGMARIFESEGSFSGSADESGEEGKPRGDSQRKRRRLNSDGSHTTSGDDSPRRTRCAEDDTIAPRATIDELSLLNNDFAGGSVDSLAILRAHVGHVSSNEWTGKRNVYDDEV